MDKITFDQLPLAVSQLSKKLEAIDESLKRLLLEKEQNKKQEDEILSLHEAKEVLGLSAPTMYSKVSRGELPVMKRGNRLYFSKKELLEYLKAGRKKTNAEIEAEAEAYLNK